MVYIYNNKKDNTLFWIKSCIQNLVSTGFYFYAALRYPIPWYTERNHVSDKGELWTILLRKFKIT